MLLETPRESQGYSDLQRQFAGLWYEPSSRRLARSAVSFACLLNLPLPIAFHRSTQGNKMKIVAASITVVFLVLLLGSPNADAQAFGIKMGQKAASLEGAVEQKENRGRATRQYVLKTVPLPNSEFESYLATETTRQGICKVSGIGKTHVSDRFGFSIRRAFDELDSALTARYGEATGAYDFLHAGSIWSEADEFAMSLRRDERSLTKIWEPSGEAISAIMLDAKAVSSSDTYLTLSYEFTNFDACVAENKLGDQDGL
jgi:hypothetical protein